MCSVGEHATDGAVEDSRRGAVMEGTKLFGVDDVSLVKEVGIAELVPHVTTGNVDFLASDHNDLLAGEELLGHYGCQTTKEVALSIYDHWGGGEGRHVV